MKTRALFPVFSAIALYLLASTGFFVGSSLAIAAAQQNMTNMPTAINETGAMMGNQINQTGQVGNKTQQGGETLYNDTLHSIKLH